MLEKAKWLLEKAKCSKIDVGSDWEIPARTRWEFPIVLIVGVEDGDANAKSVEFWHDEAASPRPIKFENWPASPPSEEGRENEPPDGISLEFGMMGSHLPRE